MYLLPHPGPRAELAAKWAEMDEAAAKEEREEAEREVRVWVRA